MVAQDNVNLNFIGFTSINTFVQTAAEVIHNFKKHCIQLHKL